MTEPAVIVEDLRKSYGPVDALRGIDLEVQRGEVFAFLGPNGAGKTTTVEILEGYRRRDSGRVTVIGVDPEDGDRRWRERIGIVLQECRMEPALTAREALTLYAGYYPSPRRVDETIDLAGLRGQADQRARSLSGGQRRRLDVALALIGDPELLFLDEPTTGFDPSARRQAWDVIASLRELGKTVFLTTHYMDEAQFLADRVAVIHGGAIVGEGSPDQLGGRAQAETTIRFNLPAGIELAELSARIGAPVVASNGAGRVEIGTPTPVPILNRLTAWALERDVDLAGLEVHRPSLEDVYLELTQEIQ